MNSGVKPSDHPEFFRFAPPPGASRDSTIVLSREGLFFHDGERVDHPALEQALHRWIAKHPDNGRFILTNGYDWCYFRVEDAPFVVRALRISDDNRSASLLLSDETEEPLDPRALSIDDEGVVYAAVKGGAFEARFSRHAQTSLAPLLVSAEPAVVCVGDLSSTLGARQKTAQ